MVESWKELYSELDWVNEQTISALWGLKMELLIKREPGKNARIDTSDFENYLETLKDKKTYEEVMAHNSSATIMSVQVLLRMMHYYGFWRLDGVLRDKWKLTSKTMEAIKLFQKRNGLVVDGLPWPKTIRKLLDVYKEFKKNEHEEYLKTHGKKSTN